MFKISLIEGIKNIDKNKKITYLSVILFTLLFILQSYTYSYHTINEFQKETAEHATVKNYQIYSISGTPIFRLKDIDPELFSNIDLEKETAEFYDAISNSEYVKYSYIDHGGMIIENFKGDPKTFLKSEYSDGLFYVYDLWTSPNFHKIESYRVIKGRDFTDEDMIFVEGGTRPVLLGYKYLDVYEVGDVLDWFCEGDYQPSYVTPKLEVIGFLAEDTTIIDSQGNIYDLDNCIVYPRYFIPIDEWQHYSERAVYHACNTDAERLFMNTKFLVDSQYESEGLTELQTALNDFSGVSKYRKVNNRNQAIEKVYARTEALTNFALMITGVLMTFAVVTVIFSVINRIENNLKDYAIHISIGASSNNIIGFVISETVIILSCSVALGLIFSKWLMAELYMPYYFLEFLGIFAVTSLLVILLSAITAKLALKKYDLCTLIK